MMTARALTRAKRRRLDVEPIYVEIGELIRTVRQAREVPVHVVADALGVSRQQMTSWEAGRARIPLHRLYALAAYWDTSVAVFTPRDAELEPIAFHLNARASDLASLRHLADQARPAVTAPEDTE